MVTGDRLWLCKTCGRQTEIGMAPDAEGNCDRCAEASIVRRPAANESSIPLREDPIEESRRRGIVARLRERYSEAREIVSAQELYSDHHGNLEWILGVRRNRDQDDAAWGSGIAELVVLWLEDFVLEIDGPALAPDHSGLAVTLTSAEEARRRAAKALRGAARDFAEAFLVPRGVPACGP